MTKKHLIIEKAIELFAENGIESTSVQQITERCGISKGAFYLHFKSKDELIISLIDYFMGSIVSDIEQSVINERETDRLLYHYLHVLFTHFHKEINVAKIFTKEQVFTIKKEFLDRFHVYSAAIDNIVLELLKKQYPELRNNMYLDLRFSINGFVNSYLELFLLDDEPIDIDRLCKSIVEKVTIIAKHVKEPFITMDYLIKKNSNVKFTKEQLSKLLKEAIQENQENGLISDSLTILLEQLESPNLSEVMIQGLLNNIRTNNHCKWVAYIYQQYWEEIHSNKENN